MAAYAVFEPPPRANRPLVDHAARFVFLRERFSWGAFLLGPLWMIWRRLWLVLLIYLVAIGLLYYGLQRLGIPQSVQLVVNILVALLIGIEAPGLRRWTLLRRGWRERGVVVADDLEMAERRFFDAWTRERSLGPPPPPPPPRGPVPSNGVIGLFPEPGGGR
ncbi:MAG: DUF2628 domain-containing protein [Xanthobacteraceae bacterium]|nr:DUF2628 domain-containing protein [Xanthobacteraceae bacterium]